MLAGIMTFTDKVIDEDTASELRGVSGLPKIGLMIDRAKEEAVAKERRKTEDPERN